MIDYAVLRLQRRWEGDLSEFQLVGTAELMK